MDSNPYVSERVPVLRLVGDMQSVDVGPGVRVEARPFEGGASEMILDSSIRRPRTSKAINYLALQACVVKLYSSLNSSWKGAASFNLHFVCCSVVHNLFQ